MVAEITLRKKIESELSSKLDAKLVSELLNAYDEAKRNFYLGGYRLSAVEGGRFCEAAFRLLQLITTKSFTPIGTSVDTEKIIWQLSSTPRGSFPESVRLHIPRALRLIYDIRNCRDAAHLADGIDPNTQDATLVVSVLDWVLSELIRLFHGVSPDETQRIVNLIVTRNVPVIQDFNGVSKILNPELGAGECCLVILYRRSASGATLAELKHSLVAPMRSNLQRTLRNLDESKRFVHYDGSKYFITRGGELEVERRRLVDCG